MTGSRPVGIAVSWDAFFKDWVKPVVHFGTPVLIVFAVLLTLARVLTRRLVTKDSPGTRSAKARDRWPVGGMYWLGVGCLLYSAVEATVVFPFGRHVRIARHALIARHAPWTAAVSIVMAAAGCAVVLVLYYVVGRPLRRQVYTPRLSSQERKARGLGSYARVWMTMSLAAGLGVVAAVLIAGLYGVPWLRLPGLDWQFAPFAYAPLLAVLGIVIVGRTRGIGMGLLMQGHDKTGGDDGGLGASVRAHLYTLGGRGPAGIQVTQNTDVSTLPSEALSLIPEGALAKVAALFVSLFTPATPWRVDVTEQADGSIIVSILRNGAIVGAAVIRRSMLWLPEQRAGEASTDPAGDGAAADWAAELRTAAAAFILLTMSKRYYHLRAGLSGATEWRSVALQVIAADPASHLSDQDRSTLRVHAVAEDNGNKAAELALLNSSYRTETNQTDTRLFSDKLNKLLQQLPNNEGMWPLRLRLRFNLLVALLNYAAAFGRPNIRRVLAEVAANSDAAKARDALCEAETQARHLIVFWRNRENQKAFPGLWRDMYAAVDAAAEAIKAEWGRRFADPMIVGWQADEDPDPGKQVKMTLLARYEHACSLVGRAASSTWRPQSERLDLYKQALDELEMATAAPSLRAWARADPSLADIHDIDWIRMASTPGQRVDTAEAFRLVDRFKRMVGDPIPADFLDLSPFAGKREDIEQRGIHTAAQLSRVSAATLVTELCITSGVASRCLEVADLYKRLLNVPPASNLGAATANHEAMTTALVFLLLEIDLDSVARVRAALDQPAQLRKDLLDQARAWAVVAPGQQEVSSWQASFVL
jgi:hypothetical protein